MVPKTDPIKTVKFIKDGIDLINKAFSENPNLSSSEEVKKACEESLGRPIDKRDFVRIVYSYFKTGAATNNAEIKGRFKKIFFEFFLSKGGVNIVANMAMRFEGLDDIIESDDQRKYLLDMHTKSEGLDDLSIERVRRTQIPTDYKVREIYEHAKYDIPLIIVGETGTGKELVCRAIYTMSERRLGPFREINCAAIPETLLESELFGYKKGAHSEAKKDYVGLFEQANGGTLFLDEIGKMSTRLQAKLLKAVDEKKITPLGGKPRDIDVRFIAAAQPEDMKNILPDLKSRLGDPDIIEMSTLNERLNEGDDVASVTFRMVLDKVLQEMDLKLYGEDSKGVSLREDSKRILLSHKYAGNYRELRNILRSAIISTRSRPDNNWQIIPEDLRVIKKRSKTEDTTANSTHETRMKDIKLKDIISHADKVRAAMIEEHICDILKGGKDIKSVFIDEGNPEKEYQNFLKKIRLITGKGIRDLKKSSMTSLSSLSTPPMPSHVLGI